ncbi:MAG: uracil-DNA glycosylase [Candidatus Zambryskibacteria bacterium]|nr:uracil-DNA glycosylase [Candidatus Zambryskibacteria bacterium]
MKDIEDELLAFTESPLCEYRTENKYFPVVGEGSCVADIVFIGEAPGKTEAETGKPFCGRSGKLLDELIASIGLVRADVYITNIVKDRPPENRDPTAEEIKIYGLFLDRQLEILKPKVVTTLGRFAMNYIAQKYKVSVGPIGEMHGKVVELKSRMSLVPLYHPAVALYNGSHKQTLLDDFQVLKQFI